MTLDLNSVGNQQVGSTEGVQINRLLAQREGHRHSWHRQFDSNYVKVAETVSHSIASEVVKRLQEQLRDPYKALPTSAKPLVSTFSLEMSRPEKVSRLQSLAKETAELEPFKEWFAKFGTKEKSALRAELDEDFDEKIFSCSLGASQNPKIEFEFFQTEMAKLCERIESAVHKQLSALHGDPENKSLRFEVERYGRNSGLFSKTPPDDSIRVAAWIELKK